jgi:hypothetical protein
MEDENKNNSAPEEKANSVVPKAKATRTDLDNFSKAIVASQVSSQSTVKSSHICLKTSY